MNIGEVPMKCPVCKWSGTVDECYPDVDGDGSLGCPDCLSVVEEDGFPFYCIVHEDFIVAEGGVFGSGVIASVKDGGWHCAAHSREEVEAAKGKLGNKIFDQAGNAYVRKSE